MEKSGAAAYGDGYDSRGTSARRSGGGVMAQFTNATAYIDSLTDKDRGDEPDLCPTCGDIMRPGRRGDYCRRCG